MHGPHLSLALALSAGLAAQALAADDPRGDGPDWSWEEPLADAATFQVWAEDTNGDGIDDLILSAPSVDGLDASQDDPGRVLIFFGGTLSPTPDVVIGSRTGTTTVSDAPGAWGDVNGDGKADQVTWVANGSGGRDLQMRYGTDDGPDLDVTSLSVIANLVPFTWAAPVPHGPITDLDGDGLGDVMFRSFPVGELEGAQFTATMYRGVPGGIERRSAWAHTVQGSAIRGTRYAPLGDLDADGHREAAFLSTWVGESGRVSADVTIFRGDPAGLRQSFWTTFVVHPDVVDLDSLQVLGIDDISGDGLDDLLILVTPRSGDAEIWLYRGDVNYGVSLAPPELQWTTPHTVPPPYLFGLEDLEGDGQRDLVVGVPGMPSPFAGTEPQGGVDIRWANALGKFDPGRGGVVTPSGNEVGIGVRGTLADLDNDGKADLITVIAGAPGDLSSFSGVQVHLGYFDRDGDHYADGGPDCDPTRADVNPGAEEVWYDGVDQDCDGNDRDKDEDGYIRMEDCDDENPALNPGAEEVWYDGIDQDCDGVDGDQDGDGVEALVVGGLDCDDLEASVFPGATDVPGDGIDQDCDGADAEAMDEPVDDTPVVEPEAGCGCTQGRPTAAWLLPFALLALRRRRQMTDADAV